MTRAQRTALIFVAAGLCLVGPGAGGISARENGVRSLDAARALMEKGAYEEAKILLQGELSRAELGISERFQVSRALSSVLLYANKIDEAIENAEAAVRSALEGGLSAEADPLKTELALLKALRGGLAFRGLGDIPSSNARFGEADRLATALKSPPYQLKVADAWSLNFMDSKDGPGRYLDLSLRALGLADSLRFRVEISRAAKKVGTHYALKSDYSRALGYYLKALDALDMAPQGKEVASCLNNIAGVYISLGDYAKARSYLEEAVSRLPAGATGAFKASLFVNLGHIYEDLARRYRSPELRQAALDCYSSYLRLKEDQGGDRFRFEALAGTADAYLGQGRLSEARRVLDSALEEIRKSGNDRVALGWVLSLLGEWSLQTGEIAGAEAQFKEALLVSEQTGSPLLAFSAAFGLGRCAETRRDLASAVEWYEWALRTIGEGSSDISSDVHRAQFADKGQGPFQALMRLYLERAESGGSDAYGRELFRLAESIRGRSFSEFQARLTGTPLTPGRPPEDPERARLDSERLQILKKLALENVDPGERKLMEARIIQIDDRLDATAFDRPGAGGRPFPAPFRPFQARQLDGRTALLEFVLGDSGSALFCITRDSFRFIELPPAQEIEDGLAGYLSFVEDPSIAVLKGLPAARRLYGLLLARTEPFLPPAIDRLVIVPDGVLFRVPFEALVIEASGARDPLYLGDRYAVSYAPSASSLRFRDGLEPRPRYAKTALAFGAPAALPEGGEAGLAFFSPGAILNEVYDRHGFALDPLPYVEKEIADLERRLGPAGIDAFKGPQATEGAIKGRDLRAYQVIHFACHALSDESFPLRSALVLSPETGDREDGYLQVSEIYGLRTDADLVVLSACQTGRGKVIMNEGNLGLPRVFFSAGARSVLSTLWPVNDKSCAAFMRRFYDAYFRGEGKAAALRTAKKAMRDSGFSHPFHWAGYVLTGEY